MRNLINIFKFNNLISQQPQGPFCKTFGRVTATQCNKMGFKITVSFFGINTTTFLAIYPKFNPIFTKSNKKRVILAVNYV